MSTSVGPWSAQGWRNRTLIGHEQVDSQFLYCPVVNRHLLRLLSTFTVVSYGPELNLNIKVTVTKILYHRCLLLNWFRFWERHFTTYQQFVADQSAISPLLAAGKIGDSPIQSDVKLGPQKHLGAESQSEGTIQLVPKPWKVVIIIPQRRRGTWKWVPVATWLICIITGGLVHHTIIITAALSLPPMQGAAVGRAPKIISKWLVLYHNLQFFPFSHFFDC